nr:MAG TPA: hypothetical protein [Caudoviricetes sp.]
MKNSLFKASSSSPVWISMRTLSANSLWRNSISFLECSIFCCSCLM